MGFITNPTATTVIEPGHILIAIGTPPQLSDLASAMRTGAVDQGVGGMSQ